MSLFPLRNNKLLLRNSFLASRNSLLASRLSDINYLRTDMSKADAVLFPLEPPSTKETPDAYHHVVGYKLQLVQQIVVSAMMCHFRIYVCRLPADKGTVMDWELIGKWLAGIIAAVVASGIVIKITRRTSNRSSNKSSTRIVSQKNNHAGGDIVAGNSIKKNNK